MNDLTGKRYGKLIVISKVGVGWLCRCDCGGACQRRTGELNAGRRLRCSKCSIADRVGRLVRMRKAAVSSYPKLLRKVWDAMKRRCYKPQDTFFKYYGGRGIKVCQEWLDAPTRFYDWAISHGYRTGVSIDRIDSDGDYSPDNCRWTTPKVQSLNRRSVKLLTWHGKTQCIAAWASELGVKKASVWYRFKSGWSVERVLGEPFK